MSELTKKERIQKYGEVFSPQWLVEQMCDELPEEAFAPDKTFLEPACGDGVFVCEILRRKFHRCKKRRDYSTALASVYAMDIQQRNVDATIENVRNLCNDYFKPNAADIAIIGDHIILCDSLKVMRMMNDPQLWRAIGQEEGQGNDNERI